VAGWLGEAGAVVVDADRLARAVVEPGEPALEAVIGRFGRDVLKADGSLDRAVLGRAVFTDAAALRDLEAIIHPAVRPRIEAAVAEAEAAGAPGVVIEAIKLVEAGYAAECDEVWLVVCEPDEQLERLTARGLPPTDAMERMESQGDLAARLLPHATRVLHTSGPPVATRAAVEEAWAAALAAWTHETPRRRA
jgi:dephospho-CoA kinase